MRSLSKTLTISLMLLTALLFGIGLMSSWFLKRIDDKYSELVAQTARSMNNVHDIAFHSGVGCVDVLAFALTPDAASKEELLRDMQRERAANDKVFEDLQSTIPDAELKVSLADVIRRRAAFRLESEAFIQHPATTAQPPLLSSFMEYQNACDKLGDQIEAKSLQLSAQATNEVRKIRSLFLMLGVAPVGVAFGLIVLMFFLVAATPLEVELREQGPGDGRAEVRGAKPGAEMRGQRAEGVKVLEATTELRTSNF